MERETIERETKFLNWILDIKQGVCPLIYRKMGVGFEALIMVANLMSFPSMEGFLVAWVLFLLFDHKAFFNGGCFLHGWAPKLGASGYFMMKFSSCDLSTISFAWVVEAKFESSRNCFIIAQVVIL